MELFADAERLVGLERGMEAAESAGKGAAVVADDPELTWPKEVPASLRSFAIDKGMKGGRLYGCFINLLVGLPSQQVALASGTGG